MIKINVRNVMKSRNLNIGQLSELTGISRNGISKMLNDKNEGIKYETINSLCKALNCQPGDLFEYIEDEKKSAEL